MELKSERSQDEAYVSFKNNTSRSVAVVWYDFNGKPVTYSVLKENQWADINTFKGHPWVCFDHATGARLLLNGKPVFYPVSFREIHERLQMVRIPIRSVSCRRSEVNVSVPLFSLKQLCQQFIARMVEWEGVASLEIPDCLKEDLRSVYDNRYNYLEHTKSS